MLCALCSTSGEKTHCGVWLHVCVCARACVFFHLIPKAEAVLARLPTEHGITVRLELPQIEGFISRNLRCGEDPSHVRADELRCIMGAELLGRAFPVGITCAALLCHPLVKKAHGITAIRLHQMRAACSPERIGGILVDGGLDLDPELIASVRVCKCVCVLARKLLRFEFFPSFGVFAGA
jgi:hypothetical protein